VLVPIDNRRGGITREVVALHKPIELFLRLKEPPRYRGTEISNPSPSGKESCKLG
jgi:hypothetical protein